MSDTRGCIVNGKPGYFHCWESNSRVIPPSLLVGGQPCGIISQVFGIVEFSDGVKRIDPCDIIFTDEENVNLGAFEKFLAEKENEE